MTLDKTRKVGRGPSHRARHLCISVTCGCVSDCPQATSIHYYTVSVGHGLRSALLGSSVYGPLVVVKIMAGPHSFAGLTGPGDSASRTVPSHGCCERPQGLVPGLSPTTWQPASPELRCERTGHTKQPWHSVGGTVQEREHQGVGSRGLLGAGSHAM